MSENAKIGYGATLAYGDAASPEVFTNVVGLTSLGGMSFTVDAVDATDMLSPDAVREKIAGLIEVGDLPYEGELLHNEVTQFEVSGLLAKLFDRTTRNWRLTINVTPSFRWNFRGFVSNWEGDVPMDDKMTLSGSITVSGKPTITRAS